MLTNFLVVPLIVPAYWELDIVCRSYVVILDGIKVCSLARFALGKINTLVIINCCYIKYSKISFVRHCIEIANDKK